MLVASGPLDNAANAGAQSRTQLSGEALRFPARQEIVRGPV